jgi:phenylpropionate dioxygenase-like ring-hydroxylating dioxygenase large terminal subunit
MPARTTQAASDSIGNHTSALIPKERYTSSEFMRLEWERMWTRVWLLAGRESDATTPGDYFTFEIGPESILVCRDRQGRLGAHYNVCLHRGNRLCEPGMGRAASFTCAFHGWDWDLDGALRCAVDAKTFSQGIPKGLRLSPVRCETWGGFVWINLDPNAGPLHEYLEVIPQDLEPYRMADQVVVDDFTIEVGCNWKTSVDAFNEAYHLAATHPQLIEWTDDVNVPIDLYDRHSRFVLRTGVPSPRAGSSDRIPEPVRELLMRGSGIDPDAFTGTMADVRPAVFKATRKLCADVGIDLSRLADEQLIDDYHYTIFPNITLNIHGRGFWLFRHRPHPTDSNKMLFDYQDFAHLPPGAAHQRPAPRDYTPGSCSLGEVMDQDLCNLPRVQAGMNSRAFTGLLLGDQERRIRHFHRTLERYVDGGNT